MYCLTLIFKSNQWDNSFPRHKLIIIWHSILIWNNLDILVNITEKFINILVFIITRWRNIISINITWLLFINYLKKYVNFIHIALKKISNIKLFIIVNTVAIIIISQITIFFNNYSNPLPHPILEQSYHHFRWLYVIHQD